MQQAGKTFANARHEPGPIIALVGSDGSGKSTVGAELLAWMRGRWPTALCHLGKQSGNTRRRIAHWPLIGRRIDSTVASKSEKARGPNGPGTLSALVVSLFLYRRLWRFRRMLALRRRGTVILADRFPQLGLPGGMDGINLYRVTPASGWIANALARRERRCFEWMTSHAPTLVIRLNVDPATAIARKPDHDPAALRAKIEDLGHLRFGAAPIVDLDATQPLAVVLAGAKQAISAALLAAEPETAEPEMSEPEMSEPDRARDPAG